jgi:putative transposase
MAEPKRDSGSWILPDQLWDRMEVLLPKYTSSSRGGRPRTNLRAVANENFYVLRNGCQWKAVPREYGSGSTLHRYFQQWEASGVFRRLWKSCLLEYEELRGIQWNWQSVDGAMTKSPLGGEKYRQKPDRSWQAGHQAIGAH